MSKEEAWQELNDKLYKAKHSLHDLILKTSKTNLEEVKRLQNKKEGVELAIQYMFDIERSFE